MKRIDQKYLSVFCLLITICIPSFVFADAIDDLHILKISAQDERAVIKTPDGKLQIIKVGDSLGTSGEVAEIAADRIVFEVKKGTESEKVIVRLIDGKQNIARLKKTGEQSVPLLAPAEIENKSGNKL